MKKILVPFDFSVVSKDALRLAIDIAARTGGSVTVLYVIYLPTLHAASEMGEYVMYSDRYISEIEEDVKTKFLLLDLEQRNAGISISFQTATGDVTVSILNKIQTDKIDLVVMGASGSSAFMHVIGSHTEKIIGHAGVPVLSVRGPVSLNMIKRILLPSSCGLNEVDFIHQLKRLQSLLNAKLDVLSVNTPAHFQSNQEGIINLRKFVKYYELQNYELHFENNQCEEQGILDFASRNERICVAMPTHGRNGLTELFKHSTGENVVSHLNAPIWTYQLAKS